jgi:hypothetical protein
MCNWWKTCSGNCELMAWARDVEYPHPVDMSYSLQWSICPLLLPLSELISSFLEGLVLQHISFSLFACSFEFTDIITTFSLKRKYSFKRYIHQTSWSSGLHYYAVKNKQNKDLAWSRLVSYLANSLILVVGVISPPSKPQVSSELHGVTSLRSILIIMITAVWCVYTI